MEGGSDRAIVLVSETFDHRDSKRAVEMANNNETFTTSQIVRVPPIITQKIVSAVVPSYWKVSVEW